MGVAIGVDSHKSTLAVAVLDELGRVIGSDEFSNDDRGHGALLEWIKVHDVERRDRDRRNRQLRGRSWPPAHRGERGHQRGPCVPAA
jgi:hypothetical protein